MKKLIALIVTLGLITTMSLTSFAAVTVTPAKGDAITINATETAEDSGVYTFDEATTTFTTTIDEESGVTSGNSQTTILAVAGYTGAGSINTSSIQYINQGTEKNFTFALKEGLITDENPNATVTILMGGDGMPEDKPVTVATLTIATVDDEGGEDPNPDPDVPGDTETITISGTVSGNKGSTAPLVAVYNGEDLVGSISAANDGTFSIDVATLNDGSYTLNVSKTGYLSYTKSAISTTADIEAVIKAGNVDGNTVVDLQDLLSLLAKYNQSVSTIEMDYDENNVVDLQDLLNLLENYNVTEINE